MSIPKWNACRRCADARVVEEGPDGMLAVERLDRPVVRPGAPLGRDSGRDDADRADRRGWAVVDRRRSRHRGRRDRRDEAGDDKARPVRRPPVRLWVCFVVVMAPRVVLSPNSARLTRPANGRANARMRRRLGVRTAAVTEFRILGPLEVVGDDGAVALGARSSARCSRSCSSTPAASSRPTALIDALWGEAPPRTAATSLQNFVVAAPEVARRRRRSCTQPPGYVLRVEPGAGRPRALPAAACEARAGGRPRSAPSCSGRRSRSGAATPLAEFRYEPWAETEVARLEDLRLAAVEERLDAELELGPRRRARRRARGARRAASAARAASRPADARALPLRAGRPRRSTSTRTPAGALVEELGIEPSPALQQLNGAILRQEASLERAGRGAARRGPLRGGREGHARRPARAGARLRRRRPRREPRRPTSPIRASRPSSRASRSTSP